LFWEKWAWEQHQLLGVASGFEKRSVVRVFPLGKGEYRELGLQENSVRNFTGRRTPPPRPFSQTTTRRYFRRVIFN